MRVAADNPFTPPSVTGETSPDTYSLKVQPQSVEYLGIRFGPLSIAELQDGRPVVSLQTKEIVDIVLRRGIQAERPVFQSILGVVFLIGGLYAIISAAVWLVKGGTLVLSPRGIVFHLALVLAIPIGLWLVVGVLRPSLFLEVQLRNDRWRFRFSNRPDPSTLNRFLAEAERITGRSIRRVATY
jgi:hypothetical protein